jgi:hypothetical protein
MRTSTRLQTVYAPRLRPLNQPPSQLRDTHCCSLWEPRDTLRRGYRTTTTQILQCAHEYSSLFEQYAAISNCVAACRPFLEGKRGEYKSFRPALMTRNLEAGIKPTARSLELVALGSITPHWGNSGAFSWSDERPNDAPQTPLVNVMTRRVPHWIRPGRRRRQNEREFVCGHVGRVCYACPMSLISVSTTEGVLSVLFRTSAINVFIVVAGEITATHHSAAGCIRSGIPITCRTEIVLLMKGHELPVSTYSRTQKYRGEKNFRDLNKLSWWTETRTRVRGQVS